MRSLKMRHRKSRLQLNRFTSWRKATLNSLARSLIIHQSIKTTKAKAQAAKPLIEKLISLAKANTLAARRRAYRILGEHRLVSLLFTNIGPRFSRRVGGYTRILNLSTRRGDNAQMVILELTEILKLQRKKPKKEKEVKEIKEVKTEEAPAFAKEKPVEEKKTKTQVEVQEKPPITKRPPKKFLGGLRNIFKKERGPL